MTPKQILDSFSETLMQDERILSAQERELLAKVLSHTRDVDENQDIRDAVQRVIAAAVGETVAQRAFSVLGASIVDSILETSALSQAEDESLAAKKSPGKKPSPTPAVRSNPVSPSPGPQGPQIGPQGPQANPLTPTRPLNAPTSPPAPSGPQGPQSNPLTPTRPLDAPVAPTAPPPKGPQGPQGSIEKVVKAETTVSVQERPAHLKARCVVLDEFLAPQEVEQLTRFALEQEEQFHTSEVISPVNEGGVVDYEHRRSRVLMETGPYQDLMLRRIKAVLPEVLKQLDMEEFTIAGEEVQITASGDGDFFRFHSDNGNEGVTSRNLTFVYFFHREPRPFDGGELRIHDARLEDGQYVSDGSYQAVAPQQNQIVFFPCEMLHEITAVKCPSGQFADSRFTVNGWLRR